MAGSGLAWGAAGRPQPPARLPVSGWRGLECGPVLPALTVFSCRGCPLALVRRWSGSARCVPLSYALTVSSLLLREKVSWGRLGEGAALRRGVSAGMCGALLPVSQPCRGGDLHGEGHRTSGQEWAASGQQEMQPSVTLPSSVCIAAAELWPFAAAWFKSLSASADWVSSSVVALQSARVRVQ